MYYCDCMEYEVGPNGFDCKHRTEHKECLALDWSMYCPHYMHHDANENVLYRLYGPIVYEEDRDGKPV